MDSYDAYRRFIAVVGIFVFAAVAVYLLRRDGPNYYGMFEAAAGIQPPASTDSNKLLKELDSELSTLVRSVIPSVVSIDTATTVRVSNSGKAEPGNSGRYTQLGLGSGVIVDKVGHVITNYHVIAGVDDIKVTTSDGRRFTATPLGSDVRNDIAVLEIQKGGQEVEFSPLVFADSDDVEVGHTVLAIGNPFHLSETVTRGIISAKQRNVSDSGSAMFQTDTVINPGNSGGPLVNINGQIIGINVALYAGQKDVRVWQGVGLAIPANDVKNAYEAIKNHGRPEGGYLGIRLGELARAPADNGGKGGVLIDAVEPGSPAQEAGLSVGDVVVEFGGKKIEDSADLIRKIQGMKANSGVRITVMREDETFELAVNIAARPNEIGIDADMATEVPAGTGSFEKNLGLHVRELTGYERRRLGMDPSHPGILIVEIDADSPVGGILRPLDIVTHANVYPIYAPVELGEILQTLPLDERAVLKFIRDGRMMVAPIVPRAESR